MAACLGAGIGPGLAGRRSLNPASSSQRRCLTLPVHSPRTAVAATGPCQPQQPGLSSSSLQRCHLHQQRSPLQQRHQQRQEQQHQHQQQAESRKSVVASSSSGGAGAADMDEDKQQWKFGRNEGPMTWPWKLMCAILYMLPWVDVTEKTVFLVERFPAFIWTEYFSEPFEHWYNIHEFAPLLIFFGTYLGIVRNKKISHVARYHIMMGVMLDIVAMILIVTEENLPIGVLWTPWSELFYFLMFWAIFLLVIYCLFFCFMGWYCEIPLISEGVYLQIEQAEQIG